MVNTHNVQCAETYNGTPDKPGEYVIAAAISGHLGIMKAALDCGGSINTWSGARHVLHLAAAAGQANIVEFLLDNGIDPNLRTNDFQTGGEVALQCALMCTEPDAAARVMQVLVDHGADPFAKENPASYGKRRPGAQTTLERIEEFYRHSNVRRGAWAACEEVLKKAQETYKPPRVPKAEHALRVPGPTSNHAEGTKGSRSGERLLR